MRLEEVCLTKYQVLEILEYEGTALMNLTVLLSGCGQRETELFLLKIDIEFNRVRRVFSMNGAGKMDIHMLKSEIQPLPYITHKTNSK